MLTHIHLYEDLHTCVGILILKGGGLKGKRMWEMNRTVIFLFSFGTNRVSADVNPHYEARSLKVMLSLCGVKAMVLNSNI